MTSADGGRVLAAPTVIGVLHPGAMGSALASALRPVAAGPVLWAEEGRSYATTKRAEWADLLAVRTVADVVRRCRVVVSVVPPHAALDIARQVADAGGVDLFLDANTVDEQTMSSIVALLGVDHVVDGVITGRPSWQPGRATLSLTGRRAGEIADLFRGSPFDPLLTDGG